MENLTARQEAQYAALDKVEDLLGSWSQDAGADGAHYTPDSPWKTDGLACKNCVAYIPTAKACHWVEDTIEPDGICKLWIIPEQLISASMRTSETE